MNDEELLALLGEEERQEWPTLSPDDRAALRDILTQHIPSSDELRALMRHLVARVRVGDGRILRRQNFEGAKAHECFDNAVSWVKVHPAHRLVYGFLYFDVGYGLPHVRFTPHVAVQTENGQWLDVTPHNALDDHPFLQHPGTEQEFGAWPDGPRLQITPKKTPGRRRPQCQFRDIRTRNHRLLEHGSRNVCTCEVGHNRDPQSLCPSQKRYSVRDFSYVTHLQKKLAQKSRATFQKVARRRQKGAYSGVGALCIGEPTRGVVELCSSGLIALSLC